MELEQALRDAYSIIDKKIGFNARLAKKEALKRIEYALEKANARKTTD